MIRLNALSRYGTTITCLLLLVIGSLTWFVKYPETVATQALLTGAHTPKAIVPHVSGKIIRLLKSNNDKVTKGEMIGCMETIADWQEILLLSDNINALCLQLTSNEENGIAALMQETYTHLGELQAAYQAFRQAYIGYQALALNGYAAKKKLALVKDNALANRNQKTLRAQTYLYKKDLGINQSNLEKNKQLLEAKVISQAEYDKMASENISKQITLPQTESGIIATEVQKNNITKELLDMDMEVAVQKALFREAAFSFRNAVDEWKNKYLLIAPISGTLSFSEFTQENQQSEMGKILAYVNPDNSSYYLKTTIPQSNFGKVAKGQRVILKFPAYQWQEYGTVSGRVDYVSPNANDSSNYIATIILPEGLHTNYKKKIAFREGLKADAEIVIKEMRLAHRFYFDIVKQVGSR
jgi:multidrug resistance efflux pump